MKAIIVGFGVAFGLVVGSFLGACVWRIKKGKSVRNGRSKCPKCKTKLGVTELFPVISWLWLRGKCKKCKEEISWHYPVIEAVNGLLFGLVFWIFAQNLVANSVAVDWLAIIELILVLVVVSALLLMAIYDLKYLEVPEIPLWVVYVAAGLFAVMEITMAFQAKSLVIGFPTSVAAGGFLTTFSPTLLIANKVAGVIFSLALFWMLNKVTKEKGMGWGDVLFAPIPGLLLGLVPGVIAILGSFILGSVIASTWALAKHKKIKGVQVPFLPFLCASTLVVFLFQPAIMDWLTLYYF